MAVITDAEVKEILETTIDTTPFCVTASILVDEVVDDGSLSTDRLWEIKRYLAAHFACLRDPRIVIEKMGDAQNTYATYVNKGGTGLDATPYGQQVLLLDSTGKLGNLNKPKVVLENI